MGDWRKSTYSDASGGSCVEVASANGVVVRDTTDRDGGTLAFSAAAWSEFTASVKLQTPDTRKPVAWERPDGGLCRAISRPAERLGVLASTVALAWLLRRSPRCRPRPTLWGVADVGPPE
jgi:aryl-alcohol dehydrogenase-like predicted oxidoreductase